jgi:hypothetical protein
MDTIWPIATGVIAGHAMTLTFLLGLWRIHKTNNVDFYTGVAIVLPSLFFIGGLTIYG